LEEIDPLLKSYHGMRNTLILTDNIENNAYIAIQRAYQKLDGNKRLNIMVCGPAGIGKTSFVHLFMEKFNKPKALEELKKRGN
jgi:septin family protein